ncbi:flagellar export protein FliJ [Pleionea sediminis]|uniref:flagellar export protein FliJ n=1 Tax=Pleionea sediminis TaxID=2569479 RepID=UPI0011857637|nr:flagellar export protein FliJ [Pleionea sediminis]
MKSTSKRIEPVKRVAEQKEQQAAQSLGQAQSNFSNAQAKLDELIQYRVDYLSEFQYLAQRGMTGTQLQHYKSFLSQLDKAIESQQQRIEQLKHEVTRQRQAWQQTNQRAKVVTKYQEKMRGKEQAKRAASEDRRIEDDVNSLRFSRK